MNSIIDQIWEQRYTFLGVFFIVFTLSYIVLMAIDFLPEAPAATIQDDQTTATEVDELQVVGTAEQAEISVVEGSADSLLAEDATDSYQLAIGTVDEASLPTSISIPKLNTVVAVVNPVSRTIADLDTALLSGVVRHPDSATLAQEGNVFILGHSSYLPTVFNKNFQAFNGIQNLVWGDVIEVSTDTTIYEYRVEKVYRAKATDVTVPIAGEGHNLILATCNSFGSTDDRYIVEASRISTQAK